MSDHYMFRKPGSSDSLQQIKWNHNHDFIRNIFKIYSGKGLNIIGVMDIAKEAELQNNGLSRDTIYRHIKKFIKDGEIGKCKRKYRIKPDKLDILRLSKLEKIIHGIRKGKISGTVQGQGLPKKQDLIYYEICTNKKNSNKWVGLIENTPYFIKRIFLESVRRSGLKLEDMPEEILIAYVINTRNINRKVFTRKG